jgi:flagellar protein FliS
LDYDAYSNYHAVNLEAQTARATPVQLVLILMDGLLEELARARGHIEAGRYELKAASLDRCVEILNGLSSSLDEESGGEVVVNLGRLYDYCAHRLYAVGLQLDTSIIDEVTGLLTTLRSGWVGVQERA